MKNLESMILCGGGGESLKGISDEYLVTREAKCVKREGFNKRELTLFRHSELGSESIPRRKLTVLAGKILKQVQDDSYDNSHNEPLTPHTSPLTNIAFTMAEILLSLTIIGVVAAITLPSLTGNINERTWNTQRKALYARMSQAISLMPALNGFGTLDDTTDTATETFITNGLSKVLKINNICDSDHLTDCGVVTSYTNIQGSKLEIPTTLYELNNWFSVARFGSYSYSTNNTKVAAFETQNGESLVAYYNRSCTTDYRASFLTSWGNIVGYFEANMCVNFIYDLNGKKGPNTVGKDIGFITVFDSVDSSVVAPMPSNHNVSENTVTYSQAVSLCKSQEDDLRIPNINELSSMAVNKSLLDLKSANYWSGTVYDAEKAWNVDLSWGGKNALAKDVASNHGFVRCVKR